MTQAQQSSVIEWVSPGLLKPHPLSISIYGEDQYRDLVESIRELGVMQALYVNQKNIIISGHRRWLAAKEARSTSIPIIRVKHDTDLAERRAIIEHNRYRVKNGQQFYNEGKELEAIEAERARQRQIAELKQGIQFPVKENFPEREQARDAVAKAIGLGSGRQWDKLSFVAENKPDLLPKINPAGITIHKAYKDAKDEIEHAKNNSDLELRASAFQNDEAFQVYCGDFYTKSYEIISPETVDAIITDPPWTNETMFTYEQLSEIASKLLKPGGSLFAMVGQKFLPEAISLLSKHLDYWWTLAYLLPGEHSRIWQRKAINQWKPILWFVKGAPGDNYIQDTLYSEQRDKRFHGWQSSIEGFSFLINQCSRPNDLIFDPFMGSGSTALACFQSKRRFIGLDIDNKAVDKVRGRLDELTGLNS